MATRPPLAPLEFYHVFNRGTDKRRVFITKKDYERFLSLLYVCNSDTPIHLSNISDLTLRNTLAYERGEPLVEIAAYCLMPNHFHLLIRQREEDGISRFMQKLITGYTMYFNRKNERTGVLFQGRYKAVHAEEDRHLKYLLSYIHLNPSGKARGLDKDLYSYEFSSLIDHMQIPRIQNKILTRECLPEYFPEPADLKRELEEWLNLREH